MLRVQPWFLLSPCSTSSLISTSPSLFVYSTLIFSLSVPLILWLGNISPLFNEEAGEVVLVPLLSLVHPLPLLARPMLKPQLKSPWSYTWISSLKQFKGNFLMWKSKLDKLKDSFLIGRLMRIPWTRFLIWETLLELNFPPTCKLSIYTCILELSRARCLHI